MSDPNIEIVIDSGVWRGWKRVTVSYGAKKAVRNFALTVTDDIESGMFGQNGGMWDFMPQTPIKIRESGELLLDGHVDSMVPSYDANNHHVEIAGRSKSADFVDSSHEHEKGEWKNKDILEIAKDLNKSDIDISSAVDNLKKLEKFRTNPHETCFQAIERIARAQQLLLIGKANGGIEIAEGGKRRTNGPLIEGENIVGASAHFDDSNVHSDYKVKGQQVFGSDKKSLRIVGEAKNERVKRKRPKTLPHETATDKDSAKKRAEHHRDRQEGESKSASVKVQGWRDQGNKLYVPNTLIYVYSPRLRLDMDMLIENVSCSVDSGGSFTTLALVHPKALGSKASTGSKTSSVWQ